MKVLIISANVAATPYPVFPLGAAMVAEALRRAGHQVRHADHLQQGRSLDALAAAIRAWQPDLVGVSLRNIDNVNLIHEQRYIEAARAIVARVRRETRARVLLGGSAFSIMPERILREVGADYGIVGEGEDAAVRFVEDAARGYYPSDPIVRAPPRLSGRAIPSAAYDPEITAFYLQSGAIAPIQTKRGCAHRCAYCTYPLLEGSAIRPRDPAEVVADMRALAEVHGAKYLFFIDSVFNDDARHYLALLSEMERQKIGIPWTGFFKPGGGLNDDTVERMKRTGLKAVELGTDAASDATLAGLDKDFRFDDVVACNDLFVRHEVAVAHFLMFGGPGETTETVTQGLRNLERLGRSAIFAFLGIRILPNTPLERRARAEGLIEEATDLLTPVYYLAPGLDRRWLEDTITHAFEKHRNWVFPPDALDSTLSFLHRMGYSGSLWDLLGQRRRSRTPAAAGEDKRSPERATLSDS